MVFPPARSMLAAAAMLAPAASVSLGGCSDTVTYTYVDVHITIDRATVPTDVKDRITSCEARVTGPSSVDIVNLRCRENRVPYDVGTFQWTTDAKGGTMLFLVRMLDPNIRILAEATSAPVAVSPGKRMEIDLNVVGALPLPNTGAGADGGSVNDGSAAEAGGDATPPGDAALD